MNLTFIQFLFQWTQRWFPALSNDERFQVAFVFVVSILIILIPVWSVMFLLNRIKDNEKRVATTITVGAAVGNCVIVCATSDRPFDIPDLICLLVLNGMFFGMYKLYRWGILTQELDNKKRKSSTTNGKSP